MQVIYYRNAAGIPVVQLWISEQESGVQAKIYRDIDLLKKYGLALGKPYLDKVEKKEGVWELRTQFGGNIYRILFGVEGDAIILHGFQKKTQKTPPNEIKKAVRRLKKYLGKK